MTYENNILYFPNRFKNPTIRFEFELRNKIITELLKKGFKDDKKCSILCI